MSRFAFLVLLVVACGSKPPPEAAPPESSAPESAEPMVPSPTPPSPEPTPGQNEPTPGGPQCGGIAGLVCPSGLECVDDPNDDCDPAQGGRDCGGVCRGDSGGAAP